MSCDAHPAMRVLNRALREGKVMLKVSPDDLSQGRLDCRQN